MAYRIVDEYDKLKPLADVDLDMLVALLSFPENSGRLLTSIIMPEKRGFQQRI